MRLLENVPLKNYTTLRVGGAARYFIDCITDPDIIEALRFAADRRLSIHILGGGSNTIFSDSGYDGVVIKISTKYIQKLDKNETYAFYRVSAGYEFDRFVEMAVNEGLAGVECLSGIPGSVGAAPIQNIGAYGEEIGDAIERVYCVDRIDLSERVLEASDCGFSYRDSLFKHQFRDRLIVRAVDFRLDTTGSPRLKYEELRRAVEMSSGPVTPAGVREEVLRLRRGKSMVLDPDDPESVSAGSFFMNPTMSEGDLRELRGRLADFGAAPERLPVYEVSEGYRIPAAFLIELAGFRKGYERDGAGISKRHSLAIVNRGCGAKEILNLAREIEDRVYELSGVRLHREPVFAGADAH
jgi:UDP-N-acetylmuramate dehydrogenase